MVGVGAAAGVLVLALKDGAALGAWATGEHAWSRPYRLEVLHSALSGVLYTVVMWNVVLESKRQLTRRWPIEGPRSIGLHVLAIGLAATAVFVVLQPAADVLCVVLGLEDSSDGPPLALIAGVTFVFTIVTTALAYLIEFYGRLRASEQARTLAELSALRAQINPHFLFNTLNSIAALIRIAPDQAEGVTERLADLFRYTLRASQYPTVTLRDELSATQLYIEIEQARFRDRLVVEVDVSPAVLAAEVPSLLVQPLVENAVKHGVAQTEGACAVRLRVRLDGAQCVEIEVRDTGPGFDTADAEVVMARGTGLANVRERLRLGCGDDATLTLLPDGVVLRFPLRTRRGAETSGGKRARAAAPVRP
jgi:signal transduction histidine kinase